MGALGKNIVFCADGTWGGPGAAGSDTGAPVTTNVYKLFTNLAGRDTLDSLLLAKEQERIAYGPGGIVGQIAKYLHGVGDGDNYLVKLLAGIDGAGLIARAYAVRALAGLICAQGLLDSAKSDLTDKEAAYRLGGRSGTATGARCSPRARAARSCNRSPIWPNCCPGVSPSRSPPTA